MNKLNTFEKLFLLFHVVLIVAEVGFITVKLVAKVGLILGKMSLWSWLIPVVCCIGVVCWLVFGKRGVSLPV